jgi:RecA-family ATPase
VFRRVSLDGLETDETPPASFVLAPILPAGHVTLLGGHGGAGKSLLALAMAAHVALGRDFGPFRVQAAGRVVFVSLEDSTRVIRARLRATAAGFGLPFEALRSGLEVFDGSEGDAELMRRGLLSGSLEETPTLAELRLLASGAALIVVDNSSEAFGGSEIDRREVRAFMRALRALEPEAAVLLLAHIDKAAARGGGLGNAYSGSTAWHNSARSRLALLEIADDPEWVQLLHEKSTHAAPAEPLRLRRMPFDAGVILRPESRADAEAARAELERRQQQADALALELIRAAEAEGDGVPASKNAGAELERLSGGALPRSLARESLGRLHSAGAILVRRVRDRHRNLRKRWAPSVDACVASIPPDPPSN